MHFGGRATRARATVAAAVFFAAIAVGVGVAAAALAPAVPGAPPSLHFKRCTKNQECTKPVVLASGMAYGYGTEIVGQQVVDSYGALLQLELDRLYSRRNYPVVAVRGDRDSIVKPKRALSLLTWIGFDSLGHLTHVLGTTARNVARVRVRYRRDGSWHQAKTIFGIVDAHLASRVRQKSPFGVFAAAIPRCIDARRIRAAAYDNDGHLLGRAKFVRPDFVYVCHRRDANPPPGH